MNERGTILKHVLQENEKCVAELQSAKQSIEHIEKVVDTIKQSLPFCHFGFFFKVNVSQKSFL